MGHLSVSWLTFKFFFETPDPLWCRTFVSDLTFDPSLLLISYMHNLLIYILPLNLKLSKLILFFFFFGVFGTPVTAGFLICCGESHFRKKFFKIWTNAHTYIIGGRGKYDYPYVCLFFWHFIGKTYLNNDHVFLKFPKIICLNPRKTTNDLGSKCAWIE